MTDQYALTRRRFLGGAATLAAGGAPLLRTTPAMAAQRTPRDGDSAAPAHEWMTVLYDAVLAEGLTPPNAARTYAYAVIAMYEGAVGGQRQLRSLAGQLTGLGTGALPTVRGGRRLDWPTVLATATSVVVDGLFARATAGTRDALTATTARQVAGRRAAGVPSRTSRESADHGRAIGTALNRWIAADGYAGIVGRPYTPPVGADRWRSTPPNFGTAIEPYWHEIRPLLLRDAAEVAPAPHAPFSSEPGSAFHDQAMTVYETSLARTPEMEAIARFWTDNPRLSGLPSGHWHLIVLQTTQQLGLRLGEAVEAYAHAGIALHDAFLSCWTWKYRYHLLRPVTYVRDHIDPAWSTFINTPQFPEYTSGHSVASAAVATSLTALLGEFPFVDDSHAPRNLPARSFASYGDAAREAAQSRLFGGIHYPMGIEGGLAQGTTVGELVVERLRTRA